MECRKCGHYRKNGLAGLCTSGKVPVYADPNDSKYCKEYRHYIRSWKWWWNLKPLWWLFDVCIIAAILAAAFYKFMY